MGSADSVITNPKIGLRKMKIQFPDKLIIAHLDINSIRNKFDPLSFTVENDGDILLISETKLDDSFHRFNLKYVDIVCLIDMIGIQWVVDIPTKLLKHDFETKIENLPVEINLRKSK